MEFSSPHALGTRRRLLGDAPPPNTAVVLLSTVSVHWLMCKVYRVTLTRPELQKLFSARNTVRTYLLSRHNTGSVCKDFTPVAVCLTQPSCAGGRGFCRSKCSKWEEETFGSCGAHCTCCVPLTGGNSVPANYHLSYSHLCSSGQV